MSSGSGLNAISTATESLLKIRPERPQDSPGIFAIHAAAFSTSAFNVPAEAELVDALRSQVQPLVSLVAESGEEIIGHILFSPVSLADESGLYLMGLAPMAVKPGLQRHGIGSQLVEAGLEACNALQVDAIVVLGHTHYYSRFGFMPAVKFGLSCEYDVPDELFMAKELRPGALESAQGVIRYHEAFSAI